MGALGSVRWAIAAGLLACAMPARADPIARWADDIAAASKRFDIDRQWVEAVMRAESGGQTVWRGRPITSSAGAMGLMQLMPGTWADMRRRYGLGSDPHDPHDNIVAGTAYLAEMHARFGYPGLFGAYHAGPARYGEYVTIRRPLPPETRAYMATIGSTLGERKTEMAEGAIEPRAPSLFAIRAEHRESGEDSGPAAGVMSAIDPLFALHRR